MKGIARTQKEIEFHDRVAQLGCISCRQEGNYNPWVSIHHAHGRTKPGCHMWVLPLCEPHHQDNGTAIARHPYKRRWEAKYGNEDDLIRAMWTELGVEFTEPVRVAKPVDKDRPKRATSEAVEVGVVKLREIKPKVHKPVKAKIQSAKTFQVKADKPARPKDKISAPVKRRVKIQNAGFQRVSKSTRVVKSSSTRSLMQSEPDSQTAFVDYSENGRSAIRSKANEEYMSKSKAASKARQAEYLEKNKDLIESRKRELRELKKRIKGEASRKKQ